MKEYEEKYKYIFRYLSLWVCHKMKYLKYFQHHATLSDVNGKIMITKKRYEPKAVKKETNMYTETQREKSIRLYIKYGLSIIFH